MNLNLKVLEYMIQNCTHYWIVNYCTLTHMTLPYAKASGFAWLYYQTSI